MDKGRLAERDAQRLAVLQAVYDLVDGNEAAGVPHEDLCAHLPHLAPRDVMDALFYLGREGLVSGPFGSATITHEGVREVEAAMRTPGKATPHFGTIVVENHQHFYSTVGAVQTGSHNTATVQQVFGERSDKILDTIAQLRAGVATLPEKDRAEAIELIDGVDAEVKRPSPNLAVVKASLRALEATFQVAPEFIKLVTTILGLIFG
jgi:hypothetical protein